MNMHQNKGFTMIELLIVVAIIGVLAAIAYPSFTDSMRKARRADAMDAITSVRLAQEKFRANCREYARGLDDSTATCDNADATKNEIKHPSTSSGGYYSLAIAQVTGKTYSIAYKVTATATGAQASDPCGNFILEVDSGTVKKSTSKYTDYTSDGAKRCWQRR